MPMVAAHVPDEPPAVPDLGADRFSLADAWWGAAMISPIGVVLDANEAFADVVGLEVGYLVGRDIRQVLGEELIGPELAAARRLVDGDGPVVEYYRTFDRPGREPWTGTVRASLLRDAGGRPMVFHVRLGEDGSRRPPERIAWREGDFPLALDAMKVGVAIIGLDGKLIQANRALCKITGRTEAELAETDLLTMTHPDDQPLDVELGTRAWLGEVDTYTAEKRLVRPDSSVVWVWQEVTFARDETGQLVHLIGQVIDISDRKHVERELARSRQELADLIDGMPVGILASGPDGMIVAANRAAAEIAGLDEIVPGTDVSLLIHPEDLARIATTIMDQARAGRDFQLEFRIVRPDGGIRWVRNDARADLDAKGALAGIRGTWRDVTELRAAEELLQRQASRDALTGLANRHVVFATLAKAIERCEAGEGDLAVLFVDLDGFKDVNDSYGHGTGDLVLAQAAERLAAESAGAEVVGRFGGDEFIVEIFEPRPFDESFVEALAERIIASVGSAYEVGGDRVVLGASIGISTWVAGMDADDLVNAADRAVYEAKASGRNCWRRADQR